MTLSIDSHEIIGVIRPASRFGCDMIHFMRRPQPAEPTALYALTQIVIPAQDDEPELLPALAVATLMTAATETIISPPVRPWM